MGWRRRRRRAEGRAWCGAGLERAGFVRGGARRGRGTSGPWAVLGLVGVCAVSLLPPPPPLLLLPLPPLPLAERFCFFFFLVCRIRHIEEDGQPRLRKLVSAVAGAATSLHPARPGLCRAEPLPVQLTGLAGGGRLSARCFARRRERGASRRKATRPGAGTEAATSGR